MSKKSRPAYSVGTVIHGRKIIRLVSSLGDNHYYGVKCDICGQESIMNGASIQKKRPCKLCSAKNYGAHTYRKIQEQNAYDRRKGY